VPPIPPPGPPKWGTIADKQEKEHFVRILDLVPYGRSACRYEKSFAPTGVPIPKVRFILRCHGPTVMGPNGKGNRQRTRIFCLNWTILSHGQVLKGGLKPVPTKTHGPNG